MTEEKIYEKLQELLRLAEEIKATGYYSAREIIEEVEKKIGE